MTELEVENIRPLSEYWCFWNGNSLSFFWLVWVEVQEILTSASCPCHLHTLVLICQFASLQKGQARYMYTRCRAARRAEPPQPKTNNFGFWHVINLLDRKRLEKGSQGSKSGFVLSDFARICKRYPIPNRPCCTVWDFTQKYDHFWVAFWNEIDESFLRFFSLTLVLFESILPLDV